MGKYQIFETARGFFWFNLYASNGRVIASSELYQKLGGAFNGMESVKKNCVDRDNFEIRRDIDNKTYFVLKAGNGEIILKSESYSSPSKCLVGIASVMTNGITEVTDMPKPLADKLVAMQRGDACHNCGSPDILKHDGQSRAWCGPCLGETAAIKPAQSNKVQRNAKCPCGLGKKYKQCCIDKS